MQIEISFLWKLANPMYALTFGLSIILVVALAAYFLTRSKPQTKRWQALLSEILVSVGVIGLLTFAARAHIESEIRHDLAQVSENKRLARVASLNMLMKYCLPGQSTARPTPDMESIWATCKVTGQILDGDEQPIRYLIARDQMKNVSPPADPNGDIARRVDDMRTAINNVIDADRTASDNLHRKMLVERDVSWILVLLCAMSAIFGIGLKWAKAIFEFRKAAPMKIGAK